MANLAGRFDSSDKFGKKVKFPQRIDRIEVDLISQHLTWKPNFALIQSQKPDEPNEIDYWFKDREYEKLKSGYQLNIIKDVSGEFLYTNFHYPDGIYSTCQTTFERPKCNKCASTIFSEDEEMISIEGRFCHGENQTLLRASIPFAIRIIFDKPKTLNNTMLFYLGSDKMSADPNQPEAPEVKRSFVDTKATQPEPQEKKLTIPELLVKIYDTEMYLAKQTKDLVTVGVEIRDLLAKSMKPVVPENRAVSAPVAAPPAPAPVSTDAKLIKVKAAFEEFKNERNEPALIVNDTENNMFYILRTTGFLGTEVFAKVAQKVKNEFGGEYVSQGKASHFKIPRA